MQFTLMQCTTSIKTIYCNLLQYNAITSSAKNMKERDIVIVVYVKQFIFQVVVFKSEYISGQVDRDSITFAGDSENRFSHKTFTIHAADPQVGCIL